jgi:hypothetical protein
MSWFHLEFNELIQIAILAVTCWAIWYGPQKAVKITRTMSLDDEERREALRRKYNVFHELMRTRGVTLSGPHVLALNLVQLEFYAIDSVQSAYKRYIDALAPAPMNTPTEREQLVLKRSDHLYDLLHAMGDELGMRFDKRELERLAYSPQGWQEEETAAKTLRQYAIQVMTGDRAVHIAPFGGVNPKYPQPPQQTPAPTTIQDGAPSRAP